MVDLKADMINMSYGEPASHATNGGIMKLYSKRMRPLCWIFLVVDVVVALPLDHKSVSFPCSPLLDACTRPTN